MTTAEVVAGGNGHGDRLDQLNSPTSVIVDRQTNSLLICDRENRRAMRWEKGVKQGAVVVGGKRGGSEADQLCGADGVFFDRYGHLYVTDYGNKRVQRLSLIVE